METLLEEYPGARRALFSAFHIGGCQSCAYKLDDSLAQVCEANEIPITEALATLKESQQHDAEMLISVAQFIPHLESGDAVILDIRTREEYEAIALPGTKLMTQELQAKLFGEKGPEDLIILIDHQGRNVLDQCAWFRGHGLKRTYGVDGGIDRYAQVHDSSIPRYRLELE